MSRASNLLNYVSYSFYAPPHAEKPMRGGERMKLYKTIVEADYPLTAVDYTVYGYLFRHAEWKRLHLYDKNGKQHNAGDGYYVGVAVEVIRRSLPLRRNVITDSLHHLEELGLITCPFRADGGRRGKGSCYRLITHLHKDKKWYEPKNLPQLKGTQIERGQGVKDRWQSYNDLFGVMGQEGQIKSKKLNHTAAALYLLLFSQATWKKMTVGESVVTGWFAVVDREQIQERLGVCRSSYWRAMERLVEAGICADFGTAFFDNVEGGIRVYLLNN